MTTKYYPRGTVLRFTYDAELGAEVNLYESADTLFIGDLYVEVSRGQVGDHITVISVPEPNWKGGDIVRDSKGVTWCHAAGFDDHRWYVVHNHPALIDDIYDDGEGEYRLVPHEQMHKPLVPLLRNGFPWEGDD